ncbi:hypothetical protein F1B92_06175 [Campylobacter sp. FMV-PI01]|uniref:Uncharacterized protein n=2 Tax=Campylobacter portucalensis TaxID=2608384 RepID=A0A6L5WM54_9BACT|nr:hypothetical protein [Campylobacter portucalensis]
MMENYLDKIDAYFASKNANESQIVMFGVGALVFLLVYFLAFDPAEEYFNTQQSNLTDITTKLNDVDAFLATNGDSKTGVKVMEARQNLQNTKDKFELKVKLNEYFNRKLLEVSSVTYNEKNWAKFLDSLTTEAVENDVKIKSIYSAPLDITSGEVQAMLNVELNIESGFYNTLKYINSIEESQMVVDVNGLDINNTNGVLNSNIKISVWGIKYQ